MVWLIFCVWFFFIYYVKFYLILQNLFPTFQEKYVAYFSVLKLVIYLYTILLYCYNEACVCVCVSARKWLGNIWVGNSFYIQWWLCNDVSLVSQRVTHTSIGIYTYSILLESEMRNNQYRTPLPQSAGSLSSLSVRYPSCGASTPRPTPSLPLACRPRLPNVEQPARHVWYSVYQSFIPLANMSVLLTSKYH